MAHAAVQPDGSFVFAPFAADRNTRLRVSLSGDPRIAPAQLSVTVDPRVSSRRAASGGGARASRFAFAMHRWRAAPR